MSFERYELEGLPYDENFSEHSGIWLPPSVELETVNGDEVLKYPVPEYWGEPPPVHLPRNKYDPLNKEMAYEELGVTCSKEDLEEINAIRRERSKKRLRDLLPLGWGYKRTVDNKKLLAQFINLSKADSKKIKTFAEKWGPLWDCTKHPFCTWSSLSPECDWSPFESVEKWRKSVAGVMSVLDIARFLLNNKTPPPDLWTSAGWDSESSTLAVQGQRYLLTTIINRKLFHTQQAPNQQGPGLWLNWTDEKPDLFLSTGLGFVRIVWLLLAQTIAKETGGLVLCTGCGDLYFASRAISKSKNNYCPDCGKKAAKRDYMRTKREVDRLWKEGKSINEIADITGIDTKTVTKRIGQY